MGNNYVGSITPDCCPQGHESAFSSIFNEYERVLFQSLITSFGLDFLLKDQHGGDVDTLHNVEQIGVDDKMTYKSKQHEAAYNNRGEYRTEDYHSDARFASKKHAAREEFNSTGHEMRDAYTGRDNIGFHGKTKGIDPSRKAELDHIVECKQIHDDRGRVLAGLNGVDLANADENLAWTNKGLNASMGAWAKQESERYFKKHGCYPPEVMLNAEAYIAAHPDLDADTKRNLRREYKKAKDAYDTKKARAYYASRDFWGSTTKAAARTGVQMGARQALGLVMTEIWFAVREAFDEYQQKRTKLLEQIGNAVQEGLRRAKEKYKELWNKFLEGAVAGCLSSLTTTLTNIFLTTAKNTVRLIRQSWSSLVEAAKILFINPDCLPLGDRVLAAAKVLATGASVLAGIMVGELFNTTPVAKIPVLGEVLQAFIPAFVGGILSCTMLWLLDNCKAIKLLVDKLNTTPTVDGTLLSLRERARALEEYSARLLELDIEGFRRDIDRITQLANRLSSITDDRELNLALSEYIRKNNITPPWVGYTSLEACLADPSGRLVYR